MVLLRDLSLLVVFSSIAKAQSSSTTTSTASCDPVETTGCAANPALATSFAEDFTNKSSWFPYQSGGGNVTYGSDGVSLTLAERFDNPALKSDFYIMYGKMEVELKASPGTGIVSTFYLQSDDLDEIDIEWIGSDNTQFQSNFFSKGNTSTYDRGAFHTVETPVDVFHNYTLDWGMNQTTWALDGEVVRTLYNTSSQGYPQSPMFIKMGIWAGGDPSNSEGTIEWAGGEVDYSDAPFTMHIKRVIVTDYSTGKQYSYSDQSGSWESIVAEDGSVDGREEQADKDYEKLADGGSVSNSTSTSAVATSTISSVSSLSSSSDQSTTTTSVGTTSKSDSKSTSSSSFTSSADAKDANESESSATSGSGSRSTLAPESTQSSQSTSTTAADSAVSAASASDTTSAADSSSASSSGSATASSTNSVNIASNAAAAIDFSQASLQFFAAVVALLI